MKATSHLNVIRHFGSSDGDPDSYHVELALDIARDPGPVVGSGSGFEVYRDRLMVLILIVTQLRKHEIQKKNPTSLDLIKCIEQIKR